MTTRIRVNDRDKERLVRELEQRMDSFSILPRAMVDIAKMDIPEIFGAPDERYEVPMPHKTLECRVRRATKTFTKLKEASSEWFKTWPETTDDEESDQERQEQRHFFRRVEALRSHYDGRKAKKGKQEEEEESPLSPKVGKAAKKAATPRLLLSDILLKPPAGLQDPLAESKLILGEEEVFLEQLASEYADVDGALITLHSQ